MTGDRLPLRMVLIFLAVLGAGSVAWHEQGSSEQARSAIATLSPPVGQAPPQAVGGNPLWGIPLSSLTATRSRPIFAPNRRAPPDEAPYRLQAIAPSQPPFVLVGAIAAETNSVAILVEEGTRAVIRLRQGESHAGWTVQSVKAREVTVKNGQRSAVIELIAPRSK